MSVDRSSLIDIDVLIAMALKEDIGDGDITTGSILAGPLKATALVVAKETIILAGSELFGKVYTTLDPELKVLMHYADGECIAQGSVIGEVEGDMASLLKGERVALNFLQRLSGIATFTHRFVMEVKPYPVRILDTRKTTPGWRMLEKYAVNMGGGENHRFGLFDAILIKDNHIKAAGGIKEAVRRVRSSIPHGFKIEVEVGALEEVREALDCEVDTIMLDNMSIDMIKEAVAIVNKRTLVEASGNITLATVRGVAAAGVDMISIGALTHSAPAADISLEIVSSE